MRGATALNGLATARGILCLPLSVGPATDLALHSPGESWAKYTGADLAFHSCHECMARSEAGIGSTHSPHGYEVA